MLFTISFFISAGIFARSVGYNRAITGDPVFSIFKLRFYNPIYYFLGMLIRMNNPAYTDKYIHSARWIPILGGASLVFSFIWGIVYKKFFNTGDLHGTARFATKKDLAKNGMLKQNGIICGQLFEADIDANKKKDGSVSLKSNRIAPLVCHPGKLNTLLMAPTGSGKGVSVIIPTLLSWINSIVVMDPKGENYALTARFRSKFSRVIKFAPVSNDTCRFNPLMAIRDGDEYAYRDASSLASNIFPVEKGGGGSNPNQYFIDMAKDLLTTAILHVRFCDDFQGEDKSLAGVLHWLTQIDVEALKNGGGDNGDENGEVGKQQCLEMIEKPHFYRITKDMYERDPRRYKDMMIDGKPGRSYIVRDKEGKIIKNGIIGKKIPANDVNIKCRLGGMTSLKQNPKERASCNSEINSKLSLFNDPQIAWATSGSDFEISDFQNCDEPISLYLTVPYSDIKRISPVFRILIDFMLTKFSEGEVQFGEQKLKHNILFLLDEFPVLGVMESLVENMGVLRGYGVFFLIVCQALNQLVDRYGQNHPFLDHCPVHIIFAPGSIQDAEFYSKSIGQESVRQQKLSQGERTHLFKAQGGSVQDNDFGRALLDPADIKRIPPNCALIMVHGMQPYIAKKVVYYMDPRFTSRYMPGGKKLPPPTIRELYADLAGLPSNKARRAIRQAEKKYYEELEVKVNDLHIEEDEELFGVPEEMDNIKLLRELVEQYDGSGVSV